MHGDKPWRRHPRGRFVPITAAAVILLAGCAGSPAADASASPSASASSPANAGFHLIAVAAGSGAVGCTSARFPQDGPALRDPGPATVVLPLRTVTLCPQVPGGKVLIVTDPARLTAVSALLTEPDDPLRPDQACALYVEAGADAIVTDSAGASYWVRVPFDSCAHRPPGAVSELRAAATAAPEP